MTRPALLLTLAIFTGCCLASWAAVPHRHEPVCDQFHRLEWNAVIDEGGNVRLTQLLGRDEGGVIHFWRLAKPNMKPRRDWSRGDFVSVFQDGEVLREVRAATFDETWDYGDYEVEQRGKVPVCQRRELTPSGRKR